MPANFHPDISKTVACRRVLKFKIHNSGTFEATPPSPGGSGAKNIFCIFFLGQGHDSLIFSDRNLAENFGDKFPPGGPRMYPPKGNVPAKFHPDISKTVACGRVLKFKKT